MQPTPQIAWIDPLALAAAHAARNEPMALLYSGMDTGFSGQTSLLALHPDRIITDDITLLADALSSNRPRYDNFWLGMIGYEATQRWSSMPATFPAPLQFPRMWMAQWNTVLVFDHDTQTISIQGSVPYTHPAIADIPAYHPPTIHGLTSNMSKEDYLIQLAKLKEGIMSGDIYQANLTRKFHGTYEEPLSRFSLFCELCKISPAPYSSFLQWDKSAILSSSPERFLKLDANGHVETRPIKGSAPRHDDPETDMHNRDTLQESLKERAENLMITDLMRNDLAKSCLPGSVRVDGLFDVASYRTVHHMSSTISGEKRKNISALELVEGCFPPGSMTGAPKRRAMEWCARLEGMDRGVYSGALGWFGGDGTCDLSVVIRTLLLQGNQFEFQVGGGIVADSIAEREWEETLLKARGMAEILGISQNELAAI